MLIIVELPDSFYKLSTADIKLAQDSLRQKTETLANPGFKSSAQREKEQKEREARYPKTIVRIRFPDRVQLQFTFLSKEKVSSLYRIVQASLLSNRAFHLYTTPPRSIIKDKTLTLYQAKLTPATVVHFAWADTTPLHAAGEPYLRKELLNIKEDLPVPVDPAVEQEKVEESKSKSENSSPASNAKAKKDKAAKFAKLMGLKKK